MRKHPKQAFGIYHDGLVVRMVHLVREGESVYLQGVDHTDLDKYWYKILDDPSMEMVDSKSHEPKASAPGEIDIDEFDNDYVTYYQLQPSERMLSAFDLGHGVIAINVYDDNIAKDNPGAISKKEMQLFVRQKVPAKTLKLGEYQSSIVTIGDNPQHWLHKGTNRLLDLIREYTRKNHIKVFFQLADANDVALTDYFKRAYADDLERPTLLVYLGQEFRKAFVFRDGKWTQTLSLQIAQSIPEPDVISSKLTLALDSAQVEEPERIIICGDLANADLVENLGEAFSSAAVKLFEFKDIVVSATDGDILDYSSLSKFCIPIALAVKALFPEEECFSKTNFLPGKVIESQKEFKVAWHGFLILFLIFGWALWGTNKVLKSNSAFVREKHRKQELSFVLSQKRSEAAQIKKFEEELADQELNLQRIGGLLDKKNYWTRMLDALNRSFRGNPKSWITNLKLNKDVININGVTSNRSSIISLTQALPQSSISKVSAAKIRDHNVWIFEMSGKAPELNWLELIEDDIRQRMAEKERLEAQSNQASGGGSRAIKSSGSETEKPLPLRKMQLPPLQNASLPGFNMAAPDSVLSAEFLSFVNALHQGHIWNYREIGNNFIYNHPKSNMIPAVRWWMAYRMYLDRDYRVAMEYLRPLLGRKDNYSPYINLLKARLDLAMGNKEYIELYDALKAQEGHVIREQVNLDMQAIRQGGKND
jgi:Tfp pilus assembly protein PilN